MPRFAANLTMMFTELPFLSRFAAAEEAGFDAVEFLFPYEFDKGELGRRLADNGLTLVLHNLPAGNWAAGSAALHAILIGPRNFARASKGRSTTPRRCTVQKSTALLGSGRKASPPTQPVPP